MGRCLRRQQMYKIHCRRRGGSEEAHLETSSRKGSEVSPAFVRATVRIIQVQMQFEGPSFSLTVTDCIQGCYLLHKICSTSHPSHNGYRKRHFHSETEAIDISLSCVQVSPTVVAVRNFLKVACVRLLPGTYHIPVHVQVTAEVASFREQQRCLVLLIRVSSNAENRSAASGTSLLRSSRPKGDLIFRHSVCMGASTTRCSDLCPSINAV